MGNFTAALGYVALATRNEVHTWHEGKWVRPCLIGYDERQLAMPISPLPPVNSPTALVLTREEAEGEVLDDDGDWS